MTLKPDESQFVQRFVGLPFVMEHRAKDEATAGWQMIKGGTKAFGGTKNPDAQLLSLFELGKLLGSRRVPPVTTVTAVRGVRSGQAVPLDDLRVTDVDWPTTKGLLGSVQTNTSLKDFVNFDNVDFVFYKLGFAGCVNLEKGCAGVAAGKPKFFRPDRLWTEG
jgi:hypothetical protein